MHWCMPAFAVPAAAEGGVASGRLGGCPGKVNTTEWLAFRRLPKTKLGGGCADVFRANAKTMSTSWHVVKAESGVEGDI